MADRLRSRAGKLAGVCVSALLLAAAALFIDSPAEKDGELDCAVRSVHDGDSMRVQCPGRKGTIAVRMRQIDAPELEQAHGIRARDQLRALCRNGSRAIIRSAGHDQYGRLLGDVYCQGRSVNAEMVGSGAAWVYERYAEDHTLRELQRQARAQRRGLWAGRNPLPPWQWRYDQRAGG